MKRFLFSCCLLFGFGNMGLASDCEPVSTLALWTKGAGNYGKNHIPPQKLVTKKLKSFDYGIRKLHDRQYSNKARHYKVISLRSVIDGYPLDPQVDGVLLHFANKMAVAVPLDDSVDKLSKIYMAREVKSKAGKWTRKFPAIHKRNPLLRDPRPLTFCGNKIVIDKKLGSVVNVKQGFDPFYYVSTLTGIEFINMKAMERQFQVALGRPAKGARVFQNRCVYCHSVNGVGADYGWDFVKPLPLYEKRSPQSLRFHVV